jgi:hypothetical protein
MTGIRIAACALLAAAAIASAPARAGAQPGAAPERERHGLFGGAGLYGGNISCDGDDCGGFRAAGGAAGHVGYNFTPRLGLVLDVWGMTSDSGNAAVTFASGTIGVRWWLAPIIWIHGGVGNGHAIVRVYGFQARSDDVPVGHLGAGIEVVRGRTWALAVEARVAQGTSTDENAGVQTGRSAGIGATLSLFGHR